MADATLLLRVFDGERRPFDKPFEVTLFDGAQRLVHQARHASPNVSFTIPTVNGPTDVYRVSVREDNWMQTGQTGIRISERVVSVVDLMMLPKRGVPRFRQLASLGDIHPNLTPLVVEFLERRFGAGNDQTYSRLQQDGASQAGLMTLLSISSAFAGFGAAPGKTAGAFLLPTDAIDRHPLEFITAIDELEPDRFFATARIEILDWLSKATKSFKEAPHALHKGSDISYKETRYPEGNVQFTITKLDNATVKLDCDIDLFSDTAAHLVLEVFPTDVLHANTGTDPRQAYAFRWMSVQRARAATGLDFSPPFSVVLG